MNMESLEIEPMNIKPQNALKTGLGKVGMKYRQPRGRWIWHLALVGTTAISSLGLSGIVQAQETTNTIVTQTIDLPKSARQQLASELKRRNSLTDLTAKPKKVESFGTATKKPSTAGFGTVVNQPRPTTQPTSPITGDKLTLDLNDPSIKAKLRAALAVIEQQELAQQQVSVQETEKNAAQEDANAAAQEAQAKANQEKMVKQDAMAKQKAMEDLKAKQEAAKQAEVLNADRAELAKRIAEQQAAAKERAEREMAARKVKAMMDRGQQPGNPVPGFSKAMDEQKTAEKKVGFSFKDEKWDEVIKWIAKEGDFSLQPIAQPPEDEFNYTDTKQHTITEAIDIINHALNVRGFTLVRNGKMLILISERDGLPDELIETVKPSDLIKRGRYETLKCQFDVSGFQDLELLRSQVLQLISRDHQGFFKFLPSAGHMIVREQGANLRLIDQILIDTRQAEMASKLNYKTYTLKHVDADSLLIPVRQFLGMDADSNESRDGSIKISVEPLGERVFIMATDEAHDSFNRVSQMVDTPVELLDTGTIEKASIKAYPVTGDHELVFQILQTLLEGREGIRLGQDQKTGTIIFQGRAADHEIVVEALAVQNVTDSFVTIDLLNADAVDVHVKLQMLFRQEPNEDGSPSTTGPIIMADTFKEQIIVRGTPQEVSQIKNMVAVFDKADEFLALRPRTNTRIMDFTSEEANEVISLMNEGVFGTTGRQNSINIVLPKNRDSFQQNSFRSNFRNAPKGFDESSRMNNIPPERLPPVSYTHLTLPTIYSV